MAHSRNRRAARVAGCSKVGVGCSAGQDESGEAGGRPYEAVMQIRFWNAAQYCGCGEASWEAAAVHRAGNESRLGEGSDSHCGAVPLPGDIC